MTILNEHAKAIENFKHTLDEHQLEKLESIIEAYDVDMDFLECQLTKIQTQNDAYAMISDIGSAKLTHVVDYLMENNPDVLIKIIKSNGALTG